MVSLRTGSSIQCLLHVGYGNKGPSSTLHAQKTIELEGVIKVNREHEDAGKRYGVIDLA